MMRPIPVPGLAHPQERPILLAAALAITIVCAASTACPARAATARDPRFQGNLEATVRYLQNAQHENGGFAEAGEETESDFTAWVALALAAAGINPRDQTTAKQHWAGGHSAYTFLTEHAPRELTEQDGAQPVTTSFERELLVADAAGASPYDFGGVDLVDEILARQIAAGANAGAFPHEAGSFTPGVNDTVFAILSLGPIHEPAVEDAVARAAQWLESQQECDGSWNWEYAAKAGVCEAADRRLLPGEARGEVDMTGAAIEALNAAGHPDPKGQERAFAYLREAETPGGGFPEFLDPTDPHGGEPNVASTAWVVQAMWSAGIDPEEWTAGSTGPTGSAGLAGSGPASDEPLGYLASMQQPDGHIRYEETQESNGMWMTAYVTPAFTGNPLPIPAAPYEQLPSSPPEEPPSGNGDGGVSTTSSGGQSGVIAGGGGDGAPLFSRPQPASQGHTPGGARQLAARKHDCSRPHKRNPGPARKSALSTLTIAQASEQRGHAGRQLDEPGSVGRGGAGSVGQGGSGSAGQGGEGGTEVKGLLLGDRLAAGSPGLRGAGADRDREEWPTIAACAALGLLFLAGALIERRRPQVAL